MYTSAIDRDAIVLSTRIPEGRQLEGLQYGGHVTAAGWTGYYVRPATDNERYPWAVARLTRDVSELTGSDDRVADGVREELTVSEDELREVLERSSDGSDLLLAAMCEIALGVQPSRLAVQYRRYLYEAGWDPENEGDRHQMHAQCAKVVLEWRRRAVTS